MQAFCDVADIALGEAKKAEDHLGELVDSMSIKRHLLYALRTVHLASSYSARMSEVSIKTGAWQWPC